eukprot:Selendium_serpulae@DN4565_c0_g1_i1.p1
MRHSEQPKRSDGLPNQQQQKSVKLERFEKVLFGTNAVNLDELRKHLWSGVPEEAPPNIRAIAWQTSLGYLPVQRDRCDAVVEKKRNEYFELAQEYCEGTTRRSDNEEKELRQILVDLPRTNLGNYPLFTHPRIHKLLERVLRVWAVRHPASGYVQGINEVLTVFVIVFLKPYLGDVPIEQADAEKIDEAVLNNVEADSYWCLSKVLCHIQENYTAGQPGIQRLVLRLNYIVKRIDSPLHDHLKSVGIDMLQFSFRWMNCLLVREFPLPCVVRLWDTYIAEGDEFFPVFHVYVCAVFLVYWSARMRAMDFQQLMLFSQKFPTERWTNQEIETLLAEAFVLKTLFHSSPSHLVG